MTITQVPLNQEETIVIVKIGAVVSCSLQPTKEVDLDALRERIKKAQKEPKKGVLKPAVTEPLPEVPGNPRDWRKRAERLTPKAQGTRKSVQPPSYSSVAMLVSEGQKVVYEGSEYTIRRAYEYKGKPLAILMPGNKQVSQSKLTKK